MFTDKVMVYLYEIQTRYGPERSRENEKIDRAIDRACERFRWLETAPGSRRRAQVEPEPTSSMHSKVLPLRKPPKFRASPP